MYCAQTNVVPRGSRALTSARAKNLPPKREPLHSVARRERVSVCNAGKTSESLNPNCRRNAGEVVTNFNQFGDIMPVNQADVRHDEKADPAVGTRLEEMEPCYGEQQDSTEHRQGGR